MDKIIITIAEQPFTIKQSFRALMLFEEMTNKTVNQMNESAGDLLKLFYCILKGNNMNTFTYSFEEWLDIIDEQPEAFTQFTEFLQAQAATVVEPTAKKKVNKKK